MSQRRRKPRDRVRVNAWVPGWAGESLHALCDLYQMDVNAMLTLLIENGARSAAVKRLWRERRMNGSPKERVTNGQDPA